jgi:hypothetical protein
MSKKHQTLCAGLSALYATLLWLGLALVVSNQVSIWGQLGTRDKLWIAFELAYAVVLVGSGLLYYTTARRFAGFIHALLHFGLAGFVVCALSRGAGSSPGPDNAAAGILAAANLVFVVGGALAAMCGFSVMACVFSPTCESASRNA